MYKQNIDLTRADIPLLSNFQGSGVYIRGLDTDGEVPQIYYMQNVMPTKEGYTSVRFELTTTAAQIPNFPENIEDVNISVIYNSSGNTTYGLEVEAKFYIFNIATGTWDEILSGSDFVYPYSVFFFKGTTYIFHRSLGLYKFGNSFLDLIPVDTSGLTAASGGNLDGIFSMTSALSYLVAITKDTVYWSDPIDETQFDPTPDTSSAGSAQVLALRGKAVMVHEISGGFIIYTEANSISAQYTGSAESPFIFSEIANSSGTFRKYHVTHKSNLELHFAWTNTGLQQITLQGSTPIFPEYTEYISGNRWEFYNKTDDIVMQRIIASFSTKLTYINSRYLALSYGPSDLIYSHVLMYDTVLKRWGKIAQDHYCIFNFIPPNADGGMTYNDLAAFTYGGLANFTYANFLPRLTESAYTSGSFGMLDSKGQIQKIEWADSDSPVGDGILLIGNITLTRTKLTELNEIESYGLLGEVGIAARSVAYDKDWVDFITDYDPEDTGLYEGEMDFGSAFSVFQVYENGERKQYIGHAGFLGYPHVAAYPSQVYWYGTETGKIHEIKVRGNFTLTSLVPKLVDMGYE